MSERKIVEPLQGTDTVIGRWLWALQDSRRRTMEELAHVTSEMVDWRPGDDDASIGSILYHVAAIEADWLFTEVLEQDFSAEVSALLPHNVRDDSGRLSLAADEPLKQHLERLKVVRAVVVEAYKQMDRDDFFRARVLPHYEVTPEWVLHHLMQHEAEHRSEIGRLRIQYNKIKNHGST